MIIREVDNDGKKIKRTEQVRYVLMSLKEAYSKFVEQYPDVKFGLTKFCTLRPANVKLFDHIPHHVCVCLYHENVRLLLLSIRHLQLNFVNLLIKSHVILQRKYA